MATQYSDELKAQVIAEWLAGGTTQNKLAKKYQMPMSTLTTWTRLYPRSAPVANTDLEQAFAMSVYSRAMEALDALSAHLRAAAAPEFAGVIEGWHDRMADLTRTVVTFGSAVQRGRGEPIPIEQPIDTASVHSPHAAP